MYDATTTLREKNLMTRLTAADISTDDVVLMECQFTRWKKPGDAKKKMWVSWDVGFELNSISLLYASPVRDGADPANAGDQPADAGLAI